MTHDDGHAEAGVGRGTGASTRFPRIQALTLDLAAATSLTEVLDVVVDSGIAPVGAAAGLVLLYVGDDDTLEIVRQAGYGDELQPGYADGIDPDDLPTMVAIESNAAVVVDVFDDDGRYAKVRATERRLDHATLVVVPVTAGRMPLGALCLSFGPDVDVTPHEVELFEAVGRHCGAAIERARLIAAERVALDALDQAREQAEVARDRLAFLVRVGRSVLGTLDRVEVLDRVLEHAVPRIADAGMALLPVEGGLERVAVSHGNPTFAELARARLIGEVVPLSAAVPATRCFRTGEVVRQTDVVADDIADVPGGLKAALSGSSLRSWLCVPIRTGMETIGVLALAWADAAQLDDEDHVELAVELASRAAAGLVNAALYDTQRDVALHLKATVLPAVLPRPDGLQIAARYLPSGGDVGGDWYDALVLPGGRVALTVGDVSGHGISAGSTMGQLRNAVRAYLFDGHSPAEVLSRLNGLMELTSPDHVASVVIAVVDPESGDVEWSCAGHPPALVVDRDGARAVSPPRGPVLGATQEFEYPDGRLELPEGGALLLYTDGLVERRDELIDVSIDRLAGQIGAAWSASADALCDRALEVTAARPREDDVCVLVVRRD